MADVKISALPAATTPLGGTELVPIVQGGVTTRVSVDNLTAGRTVATSTVNVDANTASAAVRITQTGAGNALVVEDSASTDATPFAIAADGRVLVGATTSYTGIFNAAFVQAHAVAGNGAIDTLRYSADVFGPDIGFLKSRSATTGTQAIVLSGDTIGSMQFGGSDGVAFIQAATISAQVDGAPGTNDMPGRLVFSTTADGASTPTERMRITNGGFVGIGPGATNPSATLNVIGHNEFTLGFTAQTSSTQTALFSQPVAILANTSNAAGNGLGLRFSIADTGGTLRTVAGVGAVATAKTASTVDGDLYVYVGALERMRITSTGNAGIGVSPATRFEVGQSSGSRARFDVSSAAQVVMTSLNVAGSAFVTSFYNALDHRWQVSGSDALRIETSGSLAVGTASANAAAQLDVQSTTKGFLPPRMTTTQRDAISSPPDGLVLYNSTTNKLQVRAASAWVDLH